MKKHRHRDSERCSTCLAESRRPWYKVRLYSTTLILAVFLSAVYLIPGLSGITAAFIEYGLMIWWAILLGLLVGGFIGHFVPETYISKVLARKKKRTILYSVIFGFTMSACSHGILAIAMELYKKGASVPAVIAFLLASPWANLTITIMLIGFFGTNAFLLIFSAVIIAMVTGLIYLGLEKRGLIENPVKVAGSGKDFSVREDAKRRIKAYRFKTGDVTGVLKETWGLTKMVLWWLLIGIFLAAIANAFVTPELFRAYLGPTLLGLFITLVLATVIEVCSEGSAPLAFEIFRQTGAFGNAFTFLMAGVSTDYTEIGLISSNIGRRSALLLPLITVPQILVLAYLFNVFL